MQFYKSRNLIVKGESEQVGNLWLGDYESARDKRGLRNDGINAVVTAGLGMKITYTGEVKHKMLPLYDSEAEDIARFFTSSYDFIDEALKAGNVLVHCYAGVSRSTTILAAYLMRKNQWTYRETLSMIKKVRSVIGPNRGFMNQLRRFQSSMGGKMEESTVSTVKDSVKKEPSKNGKGFVEGFIEYKRDSSLYQKYLNNQSAQESKKGQRSKTIKKQSQSRQL